MTDPAVAPAYAAPVVKPGKVLGIVAFVLAFLPWLQLIGVILGIVAFNQSKKAGLKNGFAKAAIIIGSIFLVFFILLVVVGGILSASQNS